MLERRYLPLADVEFRDAKDGDPTIVGYAAVFDAESEDLGGFREIVKPGAFRASLDEKDDVLATIDHDNARLLGRRSSGTLAVMEDGRGLRMEIQPPDTSYARDLAASMKRGDIKGASFGFIVNPGGQTWLTTRDGVRIRELTSVRLLDVAVVSSPAYPDASAAMRCHDAWQAQLDAQARTARARLRVRRP
jgi:uncharacterized protein